MNWKTKAAESIVNHTAPASSTNPQADLAALAEAALAEGRIREQSRDFVKSVLAGFKRFGSFTPKQEAALQRSLSAGADVNGEHAADAKLAAALRARLPHLLVQRDHEFATSLLAGFDRYGSFTPKQRPHVERLAGASFTCEEVKAPPFIKPSNYPNLCSVVNLDKFATFTVGDFKASLKNDGSVIWLKFDGVLFGVIDSATTTFRALRRGLNDEAQRRAIETLNIIEAAPEKAARESGILTGRCSCCSRPLTDPQSIEIGIGPICLAKF